jgi:acetylornithine deacetylase
MLSSEATQSADLSTTEQRALDAVDEPAMIRCLEGMLRIPSVSGSPEENDAQRWFAAQMRELGLATDLWEIPLAETTSHPDFPGSEVHRTSALGLVGSWGATEGTGPTLVLNGHIDVVPPGDVTQWVDQDPYSGATRDGAVYGRGACDMKGGLVCNLFAIAAIRAAGIQLKGRVLLESVVGEEDGGLGTFATLQRGYRGDAAIIPEPTDLAIIPACAGALTFRLSVTGRATHASVRQEGVSTLEKFWIVWKALDELEKRRNAKKDALFTRFPLPFPLNVGTLRAGDWPSSVPDQLVAEGRIGVALGETMGDARMDLEVAVAEACASDPWLREHPVKVEWFGGQFASGHIPADHPFVRLVSGVHHSLEGNTPDVHGAPYGSDLRLMVGLGHVPTLHYGPGNVRNAHAPNEHVPVAHLRAVVRTLVVAILRFCGHEPGHDGEMTAS